LLGLLLNIGSIFMLGAMSGWGGGTANYVNQNYQIANRQQGS